MTLLARTAPNGLLFAASFFLQGILVARQDPSGAWFVLPLFVLLGLWAVVAKPLSALGGFLAGSAALGGLGMVIGRGLDHQLTPDLSETLHAHAASPSGLAALAAIVSWGGLLMIAGCTAACLLPSGPAANPRRRIPTLRHHVWSLLGMLAGMQLAHSLAGLVRLELPGWGMHLAMVAAMLLGGWGALSLATLAARVARSR